MKRYTNLLSQRVKDLSEELQKDIELNEMNINEKTLASPAIRAKWSQIYFEETTLLKNMESTKIKLEEEYIKEYGKLGVPKYKTQEEARSSETISKLIKAIENNQEVVRYLDGVIKITATFGYDIKNALDMIKIESQ